MKWLVNVQQVVVTSLMAAALWLAPRSFQMVMLPLLSVPQGMANEIEKGRRYGVILVPWGLNVEDRNTAITMREAMMAVADAFRQQQEGE